MKHKQGFTLIELSIVLVIIAILLGGVIKFFGDVGDVKKAEVTEERIKEIQNALYAYTSHTGHLPCPARRNSPFAKSGIAETADLQYDEFGVSTDCSVADTNAAACNNDSDECIDVSSGSHNVRIGVLPTRTLGLPDEYMFDAWGNRFTYATIRDLAETSTDFYTFTTTETDGVISIQDAENNAYTNATGCTALTCPVVAYTIISHGENTLGAYNGIGNQAEACDVSSDEGESCDDADSLFTDAFSNDGTSDIDKTFDDIIAWETLSSTKRKLKNNITEIELSMVDGDGTHTGSDTYYQEGANESTVRSGESTVISDINASDERYGMHQWDNLHTALPANAKIIAVRWNFFIEAEGQGFDMHESLKAVSSSDTWTSLTAGGNDLSRDDVDCASNIAATWPGEDGEVNMFITVHANKEGVKMVQKWHDDNSTNHGVIVYARHGSDGQQVSSNQTATSSRKPEMIITYVVLPD